MCWAIYLAVPTERQDIGPSGHQSSDDDAPLHAWPVDNPWIPLTFGDQYRGWLVGHGRHCSCGCVTPSTAGDTTKLALDAACYIADIADSAGPVGLAIHSCTGAYEDEELPFEITKSLFSEELRGRSTEPFQTNTFYWIQGR